MEKLLSRKVLDTIAQLDILSSDNSLKSAPIRRYCQSIEETLNVLKPLLEDACEIPPDEQLNDVLAGLGASINAAFELIRSWHQTMSKTYFVLQIDMVISNIQSCSLKMCELVNSLLPSLTGAACTCIQKLQDINYEHLSDTIKEAARELAQEDKTKPENMTKISNSLSLATNLELYMEAVALENLKAKAIRSESLKELGQIEQIIPLINYLHNRLVKVKQLHSINGVPIPADFCCPLSLELMSDPVIVASGQTYERVYIRIWLDEGFNICPKTRQKLGHTNLIPNYTVKALIANWCESHDIKQPDPIASLRLNFPHAAFCCQDSNATGSSPLHSGASARSNFPRSPETELYMNNLHKGSPPSSGIRQNSPVHLNSSHYVQERSRVQSLQPANGPESDMSRSPQTNSEDKEESVLEGRKASSVGETSEQRNGDAFQPSKIDIKFEDQSSSSSANGSLSNKGRLQGTLDDAVTRVPSDQSNSSSDASGEIPREAPASSAAKKEPVVSSRLEVRSRSQLVWQRSSVVPKIISSPSMARPDLSAVENQVNKLLEDLKSDSIDVQRAVTGELRLLAKHNMENRIVIANCGAIILLVGLLRSSDPKTQENAVTTLLNLSINDNNKIAIANADAVDPLIHVLETGNAEAKENSAATLFSISVIEENKVRIGRSGAIKPLVDLLGSGTPRGKKDAATALFNLSILHENKARIVQADAVKHLVELMDPAAGMVDKAVAVLANLATIPEGRTAIGQAGGIPTLVEVVELGSARGKENAAAALLQLCTNSNRFCSIVLQEGAVPPLVALSQAGTPRAREKAQALLSYFRNQRHGNSGRR